MIYLIPAMPAFDVIDYVLEPLFTTSGTSDSNMPVWAWILICIGGIAVIAGILISVRFVIKKRKNTCDE